jgi:HSP20 family protein
MSNRDPFVQMWTHALALLDRADQMHRQFFRVSPAAVYPVWEPPVDILENGEAIQIVVALPGVAPESLRVSASASELVVSASRALPGGQTEAVIRRLEIPHGRFERRITLPVHTELSRSQLLNGCLYLTLNKLGA